MTEKALTRIPLLDLKGEELSRALGCIRVAAPEGHVQLPLAGVEISARVAAQIAQVTITQRFRNEYKDFLEAVYIFPLSGGSAVSHFEMQIRDRIIKGKVEERQEARQQYQQAVKEGKRAAMMEKDRDNVFTVQVGNIPPGEEITVRTVYSERLSFFDDGSTELRLPLVVAPRYIPGQPEYSDQAGLGVESDTDKVPDASRITPPRLAPGVDPALALSITVNLIADEEDGLNFSNLSCSQHATQISIERGTITVELSRDNERLNRDFILRWRAAGKKLHTSFLCFPGDSNDSYGMISIIPPHREGFLGLARDVVFVLDRSGSMEGIKMASAARACSLLLASLEPRDRFAIQAFDDTVEWMAGTGKNRFVKADMAGIEKGDRYLRSIDSRGGTELDHAIREALGAMGARGDSAAIPVIVILTDGQIGNEAAVLRRLQTELGDCRIFTIGIDTAVNDGFLKKLASLGGGTSTCVTPGENLEKALIAIGREIGTPLVTDLALRDMEGVLQEDSMAPDPIPDLFAGRASTVFFTLKGRGALRLTGHFSDGKAFEEILTPLDTPVSAIAHLWARTRVGDLEDQFRLDPQNQAAIRKEIIKIAREHSLLTRFTAYVVVDESEIVNERGEHRTIVQPVEMPDQWDMTVGQGIVPMLAASCTSLPCPPPSPFPVSMALSNLGMADMEYEAPASRNDMCFMLDGPKKSKESLAEGIESFMKPVMNALKAESRRPPVRRSIQREVPPHGSLADLLDAVKALQKVLKESLDSLKKGVMPPSAPVEEARKKVMTILASLSEASKLGMLQKFLRTACPSLVASLKTGGVDPSSLVALFEKHCVDFDRAAAAIPGSDKNDVPFWEKGI